MSSARSARLGLVLISWTVAGCVQAVPGTAETALATRAAPFATTVLTPAQAPRAVGIGGSIDGVTPGDGTTAVSGWVPGTSGELLIVTPGQVTDVAQQRYRRPDAARALGDLGRDELGFTLELATSAPLATVCLLFRATPAAPVVLVGNSDPTLCPLP